MAYERWVNDPDEHTLAQLIRETVDATRRLTAPAEHLTATDEGSLAGQENVA